MKRISLYIFSFLLIASFSNCSQNKNEGSNDVSETDSCKTTVIIDTLYKSKNNTVLVIGDAKKKNGKLFLKVDFDDFNVQKIFSGSKASLDLNSNKYGQEYRTRITKSYQDSINFAGHYCFVWWWCGNCCWQSVIVDAETGKIYDGVMAAWGYEYRKDSRLLIVNPADSSGYCDVHDVFGSARIFEFSEDTKTFTELE